MFRRSGGTSMFSPPSGLGPQRWRGSPVAFTATVELVEGYGAASPGHDTATAMVGSPLPRRRLFCASSRRAWQACAASMKS